MDFDLDTTAAFTLDTIRREHVKTGVKKLLAYCEKEDPDEAALVQLKKIDFVADAKAVCEFLNQFVSQHPIPATHPGLCLSLDGLHMPSGNGLTFCCSRTVDNSDDAEWSERCDLFANVPSPALSEAYRHVSGASLTDYVFCLGYAGLLWKEFANSVVPKVLLGKARSKTLCWGFHEGYFFRLGTLSKSGFLLNLPIIEKPAEIPRLASANRQSSVNKVGLAGWLQRAEESANLETSPDKRAELIAEIASVYAENNMPADAERLIQQLQQLVKAGVNIEENDLWQLSMDWLERAAKKINLRIPPELISNTSRFIAETKEKNRSELERLIDEALGITEKASGTTVRKIQNAHASAADISEGKMDEVEHKLLNFYIKAEALDEALQLVRENEKLVWVEFIEALWRAGRKREYQKYIKTFAPKRDGDHMCLFRLKCLAELQFRIGDSAGVRESLRLAKLVENTMDSRFAFWQTAHVLGDVGVIAKFAADTSTSREYLQRAEEMAEAQSNSKGGADSVTTAWLSMTEAYTETGDIENALRCARRIPNRQSRQNMEASLLAQLGRDDEAESILNKCKTPKANADLALWVARHLARQNNRK
ncbi:MAG TPA: hypothetical protein VEK08_20445 [Planctomycetota bacterium]|nr:hypothetical protein [Planctomycetota bacterium]